MSSELERRLEGFLHELPQPEPEVGERALAASLAALQPTAPARRGIRTAVVVFAAAFVLLAVAAGSLAAAGALHVSLGSKGKPHAPTSRALRLPTGAAGIAAVIDGKLSVLTKSGFRLQGLRVSAAALSPHALYVAVGIGHSLVAMAPDGRRAWSRAVAAPVSAISWAPDGLRIAYVVGKQLHVIYGNGTHDALIDRSVRAVQPSWRADSLAFGYVGGGGKGIVYDLAHRSRRVLKTPTPVTHLAFAPSGTALAFATPESIHAGSVGLASCSSVGIGWLGERKFGYACRTPLLRFLAGGTILLPGRIEAFATSGERVVVAVVSRRSVVLLAGTPAHLRRIASLSRGASVSDLQLG